MSKEILTIITLTKNSEKYISDCIKSLLIAIDQCDIKLIKHIVVDGNSKDNTLDIIKKLSSSTEIYNDDCAPGIYNAINYAIKELVHTPYVCYLHSDDMIDKNFLKIMLNAIVKNAHVNKHIFVGSVLFINQNNKKLYLRRPPHYFEFFQKQNNLIFHPNAIYPSEIERNFPYDQKTFSRKADGQHILEIMKICKQIRIKKAIYKFRLSSNSWTFNESIKKNVQDKSFFSRVYINLFEDNFYKRLFMKIFGKSYWN